MKNKQVIENLLEIYKSLIEINVHLENESYIRVDNEIKLVLDTLNIMYDIEKTEK